MMLRLISILDTRTDNTDSGHSVDVVYCDFMKAFNRVPHKRLLEKYQVTALNDSTCLHWIRSFLSGRQINGKASDWGQVTSGILQSSVLGLLLFVLFINDLHDSIRHDSEVYLYANDPRPLEELRAGRAVTNCGKIYVHYKTGHKDGFLTSTQKKQVHENQQVSS